MSDNYRPPDNGRNVPLWLVGSGRMAAEYVKVLRAQQTYFIVIGRGEVSARAFASETGIDQIIGGIDQFLLRHAGQQPSDAIVAVGVRDLARTTRSLLKSGVRRVLVEKPAGLTHTEIAEVAAAAETTGAHVFVAYNRRFYESVKRGREMINQDGGVSSFLFEFTEWSNQISQSVIDPAVKENWFLANSSHVLDLAFFLGGKPERICTFKKGTLSWHRSGSSYAGSGSTVAGALFSYSANWEAPGRWGLEVLTKNRRLIYRPLETLKIQHRDSLEIVEEPLGSHLDTQFKAGLYRLVEAFITETKSPAPHGALLTIQEHAQMVPFYEQIRIGHCEPDAL